MVVTRSQSGLIPPTGTGAVSYTSAAPALQAVDTNVAPPSQAQSETPTTSTGGASTALRPRSVSTRTSRSSATVVVARKLAAEAQHARYLARLELQELEAQLAAKKLQLDRNTAELQHQADLAAIEAERSQLGTRSSRRSVGSIESWLQKGNENDDLPGDGDIDILPNDHRDNALAATQIVNPQASPQARIDYTNNFDFPQASHYNKQNALRTEQPTTTIKIQAGLQRDYSYEPEAPAGHHHRDGADPVLKLASAIEGLVFCNNENRQKSNVNLAMFDGKSPLDWLVFERSYYDSEKRYTPSENLARLSIALKGTAREAVCVLLATAQGPHLIMKELKRRFGRPEQIVLREVAAIRNLPKVNNELKELSIFSSRVRNCVEVVKLLNATDYLCSPELFSALMSKSPLLLRTRWMDYAAAQTDHETASSSGRVEMLSNFLAREVDLHARFDSVAETTYGYVLRERTHAVSEASYKPSQSHHQTAPKKHAQNQNNYKNISCLFCNQSHDISMCDSFKLVSVSDRWQFIKKEKICYRCLTKSSHVFRLCNKNKTKCEVGNCNRKHHTLLHDPDFSPTTTAHVDERDVISAHDESSLGPSTPTASGGDTMREVAAHTTATPNSTSETGDRPSFSPYLKIVAVTVSGPAGKVDTFALLDDGSSTTFIDSVISDRIGATGHEGQIQLDCVGGLSRQTAVQYVDFKISGKHANETFWVHRARSIKNLGVVCKQTISCTDLRSYSYLDDITTELCYDCAKPMLVIGMDNWHLSIASVTRKGTRSQPVAIRTALGWVLFGFANSRTRPVETVEMAYHAQVTETNELEDLIKAQYKLDAIGISKHEARSTDDQRALSILERTARRLPEGRFEVGLLWRADHLHVPYSYPLALSRFRSLEAKMLREPEYAKRYRNNIRDTITKGYAEECTGVDPKGVCWYLPHFGVINPNKPAKLRVVHDAAARSQGVSLNSMLLPGPDFLQPLLGILMRFREGRIALTADIKEMFPQVKIIQQDRDAQRFLWRDDPSSPLKVYRMSSMMFGACSSPSTAIYITNLNASEFQKEFPVAVEAIKDDTYMDDFICSLDSLNDAARLASDVVTIHKRGGFEMRGWIANDPAALALLPAELLSDVVSSKNVELCSDAATRTLGLIWKPIRDELKFSFGVSSSSSPPATKRQALTMVMQIYDPLGILMPIIIKGRILFQNLWRKGLGWDDQFDVVDCDTWREWFESLKLISQLSIPRQYFLGNTQISERELHVFCDASESAYVAVAYWRFCDISGQFSLALIASKARVTPLKPVSIPRLELQGALIASRLAHSICDTHRNKPIRRYFWCDSMTVLGWLRSDARKYKPFVANRVGEILENSVVTEWHWIPTALNVADDATRLDRTVLNVESRWMSGPSFLLSPPAEWPTEPAAGGDKVESLVGLELKPSARINKAPSTLLHSKTTSILSSCNHVSCNCISTVESSSPVSADPAHFSSWLRMVRATARAHQFIAACITRVRGASNNFVLTQHSSSSSHTPTQTPLRVLTAQNLEHAEVHILRNSQNNAFRQELQCLRRENPIPPKSRLATLSPRVNEKGLLYVQGRAAAIVGISADTRPIILDGKDPAVRLLITHFHDKFGHANAETVINELRQKYWILGLRNSVRSIVRSCQLCKLVRGVPPQPPMGDLPIARLSFGKRPFTFVGLDYFGPLLTAVRRRHEKRWVALFTCMTSRAVHLEIVHSLSTDAAIMCLRRFIARRGTPNQIFSDNGTTFVGANKQLRQLYGQEVADFASNSRIEWKFIPPSAPFMGGAWERLVKSVKTALRVTLRDRTPSDEVLGTLLSEAEAIVNARPLTHVSPDPEDPEALTPFHFLLGTSSGRQIPAQLTDADLCNRNGWRRAIRLADHFWRRWVREYLPSLAPRRVRGAAKPTVKVGDPVLVADGNLPRGTWPRGVVAALFPGRDGIIRVVDVRTSAGTLRRPLKKIILL